MMPLPAGMTSTFSKALFGPLDEVEAVLVAAILDARGSSRKRLDRSRRIRQPASDRRSAGSVRPGLILRRIATLLGDGVAQAGEIDQGGLAQDVVADHAGRIPGKVEVTAAFDDLQQAFVEDGRSQRRTRFSACTRAV
jgi:hypothetical protein